LFGHWIYQNNAAPAKEEPPVVTIDIKSSSRAIRDVHHLLMGFSIVIKITDILLLP
jgi:hypothetical protein